jgi:hypothetical protein
MATTTTSTKTRDPFTNIVVHSQFTVPPSPPPRLSKRQSASITLGATMSNWSSNPPPQQSHDQPPKVAESCQPYPRRSLFNRPPLSLTRTIVSNNTRRKLERRVGSSRAIRRTSVSNPHSNLEHKDTATRKSLKSFLDRDEQDWTSMNTSATFLAMGGESRYIDCTSLKSESGRGGTRGQRKACDSASVRTEPGRRVVEVFPSSRQFRRASLQRKCEMLGFKF